MWLFSFQSLDCLHHNHHQHKRYVSSFICHQPHGKKDFSSIIITRCIKTVGSGMCVIIHQKQVTTKLSLLRVSNLLSTAILSWKTISPPTTGTLNSLPLLLTDGPCLIPKPRGPYLIPKISFLLFDSSFIHLSFWGYHSVIVADKIHILLPLQLLNYIL